MQAILETLQELNNYSAALRILLAVLLGGLIGLERGQHGRAAGLRTHILVCLGATLTAMVGLYTSRILNFSSDPMRIGAQVVSGIGFLGVGTILVRNRRQVTGLTTAAGLWTTACLGLAIGVGFYLAAILSFLAVLVTMEFLIFLERSVKTKSPRACYVELTDIHEVTPLLDRLSNLIEVADVLPPKSGVSAHVGIELQAHTPAECDLLMKELRTQESAVIILPLQN